MPRDLAWRRISELLDLVSLTPHANKKLREFSKCMLQRIGLAQALINQPELVILDEPTSGLAPVGRRLVRDIIRDLRQRDTTVFLNSHLLSEVEITCDRVAFIKFGQVVRISPLQTLLEGELTVEVRADGEHMTLTLDGEADLPLVNRYLVEQGVDVFALRPQHVSLEDLFIEIVGTDGGL